MADCIGIDYAAAIVVCETWDKLKRSKDYKVDVGDRIFAKMLEAEPSIRSVFGFTETEDATKNPKFNAHGKMLFEMIDFSVGFLGPDLEPLKEDLIFQGERHAKYGVKPESLPIMINAVISVLEETLGEHFTEAERKSWQTVNEIFCLFMRIGMNRVPKVWADSEDYTLNAYTAH